VNGAGWPTVTPTLSVQVNVEPNGFVRSLWELLADDGVADGDVDALTDVVPSGVAAAGGEEVTVGADPHALKPAPTATTRIPCCRRFMLATMNL